MLSRNNLAFAASVVLTAGMVGYYLHIFLPRVRTTRAALHITFFYGEDLYPYWSGTRELFAHGVSPYSEQATREIQVAVYGRPLDPQNPYERDQHRFSYPLYVAFLMAPVAWLPFSFVRVLAAIVLPLSTLLGIVLWQRGFHLNLKSRQLAIAGILTLSSYPLLNGMFALQLSSIVFLCLAACCWCLEKRRFALAGIYLALSTIKPQLVLLGILFLSLWTTGKWGERKNLLKAFLLTMAVLLMASISLLPTWPGDWLRTIIAYRHYTVPPLAQHILGKITGTILTFFLLAVAAWLWWKVRRDEVSSRDFAMALSFTLAASVVTIPTGDSVYDHVLILPGVLLLILSWRELLSCSRVARILLLLTAAVFVWQWTAGTVVCVIDLIWPGLIRSPYVLSSPLRTQPSMPFAVLALLAITMFARGGRRQLRAKSDSSLQRSTSNFAS